MAWCIWTVYLAGLCCFMILAPGESQSPDITELGDTKYNSVYFAVR
jgi:hypothetical protein